MKPRLIIAIFGALIGVIGDVAISVAIRIGLLILGVSDETIKAVTNIWPPLERVVTNLCAGVLSGWMVAPFILRRLLSSDYKHKGFVKTGFTFGATAGVICSWLVALITISKLAIIGLANGRPEETLRWTGKLLGYYSSSSMIFFGFLAAVIGALSGALAECCFRWFRKDGEALSD